LTRDVAATATTVDDKAGAATAGAATAGAAAC
jgi:hypothetical protein